MTIRRKRTAARREVAAGRGFPGHAIGLAPTTGKPPLPSTYHAALCLRPATDTTPSRTPSVLHRQASRLLPIPPLRHTSDGFVVSANHSFALCLGDLLYEPVDASQHTLFGTV